MPDELVTKWRGFLQRAESAKKKWRETFRVDDLDKYYEGHQRPSWWSEEQFLTINLIFANLKSQLDGLKASTPRFTVKPARTYMPSPGMLVELEQQASKREKLLNYHVRESSFKREIIKAVLDAFISFGVVKVFYMPYHRENPRKGKPIMGPTGPIIDPLTGEVMVEPEHELYKELFLAERRDPANIFFDPYADSIENIEWVAERIEMTVEEVKSNKLFKNTSDIKAMDVYQEDLQEERQRKIGDEIARPLTGGNASMEASVSSEREIVYVWEIYDLKEERIICIAEGHDKVLRDDPIPPAIEDHPYCFIWFIDRRNSPYPVPYLWHQLGPQDEYNITRNQIVLHRKRFNRKYTAVEGTVDDEELSKLEEPYDGIVIKVKTEGEPIKAIQDPSLDQAVYFDVEMLRRDFMDVAGESIPDTDISKIEKATVAQWLSNRQENRRQGFLSSVGDFLNAIARKLILLYEHEMTVEQAINISGSATEWLVLSPNDFAPEGEFLYEVDVSSLVPISPDAVRSRWVAFMQFIGMNPVIMTSPVLVEKTAKLFGIEDRSLVGEVVAVAERLSQQQMLQGGQPGQPSMSPDMARALGLGGKQ